MDILDSKTNEELLRSLLAEIAKTSNELHCAQKDVDKAHNRLGFSLMVINTLLNRSKG